MRLNLNQYGILPKIAAIAVAIIVGLIFLSSLFFTVPTGHKGIVTQFNELHTIKDSGLNFKMPFMQKVILVDTRTAKAETAIQANTRDMQRVSTKVVVNYHINPSSLEKLFSQTGLDIEMKIIDPRIQEATKSVVTKYTADQLTKQRDDVKNTLSVDLTARLAKYGIVVEDVQVTEFTFSKVFYDSIESKQIAEQSALKAENDLKRIEVEAKQKIEMAKAEAEAIRIQSEAVRAQGGTEYVQLKAIEKWSGKLPDTVVGGNGALPFINVGK